MKPLLHFFNYSKKERQGITVLLIILFLVIMLKIIQDCQLKNQPVLWKDFFTIIETKQVKNKMPFNNNTPGEHPVHKNKTFFKFNPNTVSIAELKQLGFSGYNAQNIIKYRQHGGHFNTYNDLLKIYGIDTNLVLLLSDYLILPTTTPQPAAEKSTNNTPNTTKKKQLVDINLADTSELRTIDGIGPILSERIVKYRNLLGGYVSIEQLKEVYGINEIVYAQIKSQVKTDTTAIIKIPLNTADYKTLIRHPYLKSSNVKSILNYRKLMGQFNDVKQLNTNHLLTNEEYSRLMPYLSIDN